MSKKGQNRVKIGISVGDVNGIGLEVILKTFNDQRMFDFCQPILYCSKAVLDYQMKTLQLNDLKINLLGEDFNLKKSALHLVDVKSPMSNSTFGNSTEESAVLAFQSLENCISDLQDNKINAMVTAPIQKESMQTLANFEYGGHTEYLNDKDGKEDSLMLMISDHCKIGIVTNHIPLQSVSNEITTEKVLKKINILNKSLKVDFGIRKPKIAVLGLNPHAGENGAIGKEESKEILPAIQQAKNINILAFGPYPADGFFASNSYANYDGVLAMYHDQGLIPSKMLSKSGGINYTAGLSFVRTSPDHGTAFEIAGKNLAKPAAFRNAVYTAIEIVKSRILEEELTANVLETSKNRS